MTFARPALMALAFILPALAVVAVVLWDRRRRRAARALGDAALVRRLTGEDLHHLPLGRAGTVVLACAALGIAAAGPQWGVTPETEAGAADVVLVLDASNSMRVEDVAPSRLVRQREVAGRMVEALDGGRRVALVVFAGRGFVLSPLTDDAGAVELYLDALSPEMVTQTGSSLSHALRQAAGLLVAGGEGARSGAVVLLSDGDALEEGGAVLEEARRAARLGIVVHTVAIGSAAGGRVPDTDPETGRRRGWKREPTGEVAVSRVGTELMARIAAETGGVAVPAADDGAADAVLGAIRTAPQVPVRGRREGRASLTAAGPEDRYEWPVALALLLIAAEVLLERRAARQRREVLR